MITSWITLATQRTSFKVLMLLILSFLIGFCLRRNWCLYFLSAIGSMASATEKKNKQQQFTHQKPFPTTRHNAREITGPNLGSSLQCLT